MVWFGLALIALFSKPLEFQTRFVPAETGGNGSKLFSMARIAYQQEGPDLAATMTFALPRSAVMFLVLAVFYLGLQKRLGRQSDA